MDSKKFKVQEWLFAFIATLSVFCFGLSIGWSSPAEKQLSTAGINQTMITVIKAIIFVGAIIGAPLTSPAMDRFGTKKVMIANAVLYIIGGILITLLAFFSFTRIDCVVATGRFIIGLANGVASVVVVAYLKEIASGDGIGNMFQMMIVLGIFAISAFSLWFTLFDISIIVAAFIQLVLICFLLPESPGYLLKNNRNEEAEQSLKSIRPAGTDVASEAAEILDKINSQEKNEPWMNLFRSPANINFGISLGLMVLQQFSGINVFAYNLENIFNDAGSTLSKGIAPLIVTACQVLSTIVTMFLMGYKLIGRRKLMLMSTIGISIGISVFCAHQYFLHNTYLWMPLVCLCIYMIAFSIGMGPIPWSLPAELIQDNLKGPGLAIIAIVNNLLSLLTLVGYSYMEDKIGHVATLLVFAICCFLSIVYTAVWIPDSGANKDKDTLPTTVNDTKE